MNTPPQVQIQTSESNGGKSLHKVTLSPKSRGQSHDIDEEAS